MVRSLILYHVMNMGLEGHVTESLVLEIPEYREGEAHGGDSLVTPNYCGL